MVADGDLMARTTSVCRRGIASSDSRYAGTGRSSSAEVTFVSDAGANLWIVAALVLLLDRAGA
jgi:hypothetical protein